MTIFLAYFIVLLDAIYSVEYIYTWILDNNHVAGEWVDEFFQVPVNLGCCAVGDAV